MSGSFSGCHSIDELWENILEEKELTTSIPITEEEQEDDLTFVPVSGVLPDSNSFDHALFRLSKADANALDPHVRIFLQHAYLALEASGYIREKSLKVGCFVGAEPFLPKSTKFKKKKKRGDLMEMYERNQKDFIAMWT